MVLDELTTVALTLVLLRVSWIDIKSFRLPDVWTLPLIAAGLGLALIGVGVPLMASLIAGTFAFLIFWALGSIYHKRTGREGLGLGDAKLFAASGTWLGYEALPYVLLISTGGALLFSLLYKPDRSRRIAFGPWLALGFWITWVAVRFTHFA